MSSTRDKRQEELEAIEWELAKKCPKCEGRKVVSRGFGTVQCPICLGSGLLSGCGKSDPTRPYLLDPKFQYVYSDYWEAGHPRLILNVLLPPPYDREIVEVLSEAMLGRPVTYKMVDDANYMVAEWIARKQQEGLL